ncbi:hypothetical protein PM082_007407 [Marasmius tenuissimus]|nr:hypothetical protein PM082_007407 [Marasmius tenuissimus]
MWRLGLDLGFSIGCAKAGHRPVLTLTETYKRVDQVDPNLISQTTSISSMKLYFALFTPVVLSTLVAVAKPVSVSSSVYPRVLCEVGSGTALCCDAVTPSTNAALAPLLAVLKDLGVDLPLGNFNIGVDCHSAGPFDVCAAPQDRAACCQSTVDLSVVSGLVGIAGIDCAPVL